MNKLLLTTLLFLSFRTIGFSQAFDKTKLDTYFQVLEKNNKFMGSVALSKNGDPFDRAFHDCFFVPKEKRRKHNLQRHLARFLTTPGIHSLLQKVQK